MPVYLAVLFLFHPWLGLFATAAGLVLLVLAVVSEKVTQPLLAEANGEHIKARELATSNLRNAEVLHAMGMLPGIMGRWSRRHHHFLAGQSRANDRGEALGNVSRTLRLLAEQRGDDELLIPDELTGSDLPRVQEVPAVQRALFMARRQSLRGTLEALDEQAIQLQCQIKGLEEMVRINEQHAASLREEAVDLRNLFSKGMVNNQRLREVERDLLELLSEIASRRAEIARLGSQVSESRMQREIRVQEFQKEVGEQFREAQATVTEAEERITALDDQMSRATVTAPVSGIVVER